MCYDSISSLLLPRSAALKCYNNTPQNFLLAVSVLVTEVALLGVLGPTLADYKGIELEVNQTLRDSFSQVANLVRLSSQFSQEI